MPSRKDQTPAVTNHWARAISHSAGGVTPSPTAPPSLVCLYRDESGQDLVEYALVASFLGLASVAGIHGIADQISNDMNLVLNGFKHALGQ